MRWCFTAVLLLPLSLRAQDGTVRVVSEQGPSPLSAVGAFRMNGVLYCSLKDLAKACQLTTHENEGAAKLELAGPSARLKCSANNPYLVITDNAGRRQVHQLPQRVRYAAKVYYVPLISFLPSLNLVGGAPVQFEPDAEVLRVGALPPAGSEFDIPTVVLEPKANGMLIRLPATRPINDVESWLGEDGWLYVTLADTRVNVAVVNSVPTGGIVEKIVALQSPASAQLTFKLTGPIVAREVIRDPKSNDILVSLRTEAVNLRPPESLKNDAPETRKTDVQSNLEHHRKRWELDVIVIDPGHGGKDGGAVGLTGVREKDITLGVALKLGRLIEKGLPGLKVAFTRRTDTFVELHRRGQLANEADGKLFISIHCNSMVRKPSPHTGFEVYLLRPGRTSEAIQIAERENSVIELEEEYESRYKKLTDENFILVTMAQSAHAKYSELFADLVQQEMAKHLEIPNRGVKQAGFYVLVGASMPNILVETAYLSNRKDERFLRSEAGQMKFAEALYSAVRRYKAEYGKYFSEGKDIGQRRPDGESSGRSTEQ